MTDQLFLRLTPTHAQIDPTSACDLNCVFCVGRDWVQGHLPLALFNQAMDELRDLVYVQLQGEGEPMLSKRFWLYLAELRQRGIDVGFITNGRHLTAESVQRLVAGGVRTITVSIDSLDPTEHARLRRGDLDPVLAGLRILAKHRPASMDVFIASVLTPQTFDGFGSIVELSKQLGLSLPSCQELQRKDSYTSHYRGISIASHGLNESQRSWMGHYLAQRSTTRAELGLVSFWESAMAAEPGARCPFVLRSIHVRFDGSIFPCCFVKEDEFSLGRLPDDSLVGLPVTAARDAMSRQIEHGDTPGPCVGCHVLNRPYRSRAA